MANIATARIKREFKEVVKSEEVAKCNIKLELKNDSFTELRGEIAGPPDTPYEGGNFILDIQIPATYPFNPPVVKFVTKIWHPNISSVTGAVCLDILKDQWWVTSVFDYICLSFQALLAAPEPDDPQDAVVANQYKESKDEFKNTARHWTYAYAGRPTASAEYDSKVEQLKNMGFDEHKARVALSTKHWIVEQAMEHILS
ncbi:hypothetical protein NP493_258g06064 [Ridgeia piscesae]|uniref:E2 ubiquitin-conjugating enzyme n=1 Tax=Ridgeia piscesae TaxID=27915 RepID=A0AAD9NY22_RIDPI|nr:hypothetical protein NP493_258g06064 [Ridgeia piscesae]